MRLIDLTGQTFGRLTVLKRAENSPSGRSRWLCQCECGNTCIVHSTSLHSGNTRSCGCLKAEVSREKATTHGMSGTSLFNVWCAMHSRCLNKNNHSYGNYGGRGIRMCDEWMDSSTFFDWALANGYKEGLTIERIDVNGNYEPSNCKWITKAEQARNKTNSRIFEVDGVSASLAQLCENYNIDYSTVYQRITKLGWEPKRALTTPVRKIRKAGESNG